MSEKGDCVRKPIIAGNWKMNKTAEEAETFVQAVLSHVPSAETVDTVIGAPNLFTQMMIQLTENSAIQIAAQNCYFEAEGAFTGETSPKALSEMGTKYVIIGHSERRELFSETDEDVNKKAKAVLAFDMLPIICVGETLEQRENGETDEWVSGQVKAALDGIDADSVARIVLAYEPIWAIGTGKTATSDEANDTIKLIRQTIKQLYDEKTAQAVRIQYGGSVNPDNIGELLAQSDIDGALVGGASLEADSFLKLLEATDR